MSGKSCNHHILLFVLTVLFICPVSIYMTTPQNHIKPPIARVIPKKLEKHGHVRIDNYYWLKKRDNPEVIAYLKAENDYAKNAMAHTDSLQIKLVKEFQNVKEQPNQPITYGKGDYIYYEYFEKEKQYPVYCRKKGSMEGNKEVLLDANQLAEGHKVFALARLQISPKQDILAYGLDVTGDRDFFTFYFKNLETGESYSDVIPDVHSLTAWANDNKTFYYVNVNGLYSHILGTSSSEDKLLLENVSFIYKTKSEKYVLIFSVRYPWELKGYLDLSNTTSSINEFVPPKPNFQCFRAQHWDDKFYFLDEDRLMEIPVSGEKLDDESKVSFYQKDSRITHFEVFKDHLVLWENKNGTDKCRIVELANGEEHYLDFGESIYSVSNGGPRSLALRSLSNADYDSQIMRYIISSPTTPNSIYEYNMITREKKLVNQENVGAEFDPNNYESEQLWAKAADDKLIPISLVYRKGMKKDGKNPLILDAYGMYGEREELGFSSFGLSLLNRGFICAIAHVRGGGELPGWHKEGMLLKKKNSFTDFITCAQYLIHQGYTNADRLIAHGSSGGGLLIAGVITMAPQLFKGAIIEVPFLDIITTLNDENQIHNIPELGDPNKRKYYEYMLTYAPYDNIEESEYPDILITAGFHDTRVYYWPAAKFTAKLRAMKKDNNRLLFKTYMEGGHGTASFSGRLESFRERAYEYAFILDLAGIRE